MKRSCYLFIIACCTILNVNAQLSKAQKDSISVMEVDLMALADSIINAKQVNIRQNSCYQFIPKFVQALKITNSFYYPFDSLYSISFLYPEDSSFRILTWQLRFENETYRYYGLIQMNSAKLKMYPLHDVSSTLIDPMEETLSYKRWYGALYYNMIESKKSLFRKKYYTLFAWDGNNYKSNKKIMEILSFDDKTGEPVFGAPIIYYKEDTVEHIYNRFILEYKEDAAVSINYNKTLEKILYDNLIPQSGFYNDKQSMVQDGSYRGFEYKKGKWISIRKMFHQKLSEAPLPAPRKRHDVVPK